MITNFNGKELLEKILPTVIEAVNYNGLDGDEIVVVDDASSDESVKMLAKSFPSVRVLKMEKNSGFQEASNRGISFCKNRLVICLNNDMMVKRDCSEQLAEHFKDQEVFAVSTRVLLWDKKTYLAGRRYARFEKGNFILKDEDCKRLSPTLFATGGGCMLDKEKLLKLGGFDKLYAPLYWEDIDLCYRALKRGYKVLYDPQVVFYHKHKATISEIMDQKSICGITARNSYLFIWKNITDKGYFLEHIKSIIPSLARNIVRGETRFPLSFVKALHKIRDVIKARRIERAEGVVSDMDVLKSVMLKHYT